MITWNGCLYCIIVPLRCGCKALFCVIFALTLALIPTYLPSLLYTRNDYVHVLYVFVCACARVRARACVGVLRK